MNRSRLAVLVASAALASCAGAGAAAPSDGNPFGADDAPGRIQLIVINDDFNDATLFAFRGAERIHLGVVTGKAEESFELPWPSSQTLQVQISVLAAGTCTTDAIAVDPGEVIELRIADGPARGGVCAGPRGAS